MNKCVLVVLLELLSHVVSNDIELENPCVKYSASKRSTSVFPDPRNLNGYLNCDSEGRAVGVLCPVGFRFSPAQSACVPRLSNNEHDSPDPIVSNYCKDGCVHGRCVFDPAERCICDPGYEGGRCDRRVDMCVREGYQQCGLRGICRNEYGTYICLCRSGKIGPNCDEGAIENPCTQEALARNITHFPLHPAYEKRYIKCMAPFTFNVFECPEDERYDPIVGRCVELGSCSLTGCQNGGQCIEMPPTMYVTRRVADKQEQPHFKCRCKPGFTGSLCENKLDFCLNNPCRGGGRCESGLFSSICVCPDRLISENCESGIENPCSETNNEDVFEVISRGIVHENAFIYCHSNGYASLVHCPQNTTFNKKSVACDTDATRRLRKELELAKGTVFIWPEVNDNIYNNGYGQHNRPYENPNYRPIIDAGSRESFHANPTEMTDTYDGNKYPSTHPNNIVSQQKLSDNGNYPSKVSHNTSPNYVNEGIQSQFSNSHADVHPNVQFSNSADKFSNYQTSPKQINEKTSSDYGIVTISPGYHPHMHYSPRNRRSLDEWNINPLEAVNKFSVSLGKRNHFKGWPSLDTMNRNAFENLGQFNNAYNNRIANPINNMVKRFSESRDPNEWQNSEMNKYHTFGNQGKSTLNPYTINEQFNPEFISQNPLQGKLNNINELLMAQRGFPSRSPESSMQSNLFMDHNGRIDSNGMMNSDNMQSNDMITNGMMQSNEMNANGMMQSNEMNSNGMMQSNDINSNGMMHSNGMISNGMMQSKDMMNSNDMMQSNDMMNSNGMMQSNDINSNDMNSNDMNSNGMMHSNDMNSNGMMQFNGINPNSMANSNDLMQSHGMMQSMNNNMPQSFNQPKQSSDLDSIFNQLNNPRMDKQDINADNMRQSQMFSGHLFPSHTPTNSENSFKHLLDYFRTKRETNNATVKN